MRSWFKQRATVESTDENAIPVIDGEGNFFDEAYDDKLKLRDDLSLVSTESPSPFLHLLAEVTRGKGVKINKNAVKESALEAIGIEGLEAIPETAQPLNRRRPTIFLLLLLLFLLIGGVILNSAIREDTARAVLPTDDQPTTEPTTSPTQVPSEAPTTALPTTEPTSLPTSHPTSLPSSHPTSAPTQNTQTPTKSPTIAPTKSPPTFKPTGSPLAVITGSPTLFPTTPSPTLFPTTANPTKFPTSLPTPFPTTAAPTLFPTKTAQTPFPVVVPTSSPSVIVNRCAQNAGPNSKFCYDQRTLGFCEEVVAENGQKELRQSEKVKDCALEEEERVFCRCPDGLPFNFTFGCVYPRNLNTFCSGSTEESSLEDQFLVDVLYESP